MHRVLRFLIGASIILAISACTNPAGGAPDSKSTFDKSTVWVVCTVSPDKHNEEGPTLFNATVQLQDSVKTDFSDAIIRVNGISISGSGQIFIKYGFATLKTGDTVTLEISDDRLGSIKVSGTVPPSPVSMTISPALTPNTANTLTSYTVSFPAVSGVSEYVPGIRRAKGSDPAAAKSGYGTYTQNLQASFTDKDLTYTDSVTGLKKTYEWVGFYLATVNRVTISGYKTNSFLRIHSSKVLEQHN